jgi:hypothetical protein
VEVLKTDVQTIKGGLHGLETHFDQKIEALEVNWNHRHHALEHRLEEWVSDMEGRIVTTVYRLMDGGNKRLTESERETAIIKERLAIIEDRLLGVEKRLDMPK